jgi:exo-1,4-beta-D-glucosaminidase
VAVDVAQHERFREMALNKPVLHLLIQVCLATSLIWPISAQSQISPRATNESVKLQDWKLQSSAQVAQTGEEISSPSFSNRDWHSAVVPGTVLATLVQDKTIPDPYYGVNLRNLIGPKFRSDKIFSELPMDPDSQFAVPWWYRTEFAVPEDFNGKVIWLHFGGINYRADVWVNGQQLADAGTTVGTWRIYDFNISHLAKVGARNAIAVKVYPPKQTDDLAISYVDWNPGSPDRYMGLFREVSLSTSGPVALRYPAVLAHLDLPDTTRAHLTVVARLVNSTDKPQAGTLQGSSEGGRFSQEVELKPQETRDVIFDPGAFPQLNIRNPRLWWPAQMGEPNLYQLKMSFSIHGRDSDSVERSFGIREVTSQLDSNDHRLFLINGKKLLIRGGGWSMDLMMQESKRRLEDEFRYVADMGLNTIRLEGMFETEEFFDLADQKGILVMPGISCSLWETWPKWGKEQVDVAEQSLRSQILRLRSHPSILAWLNGSDNPPPPDIERMYLAVEREYLWPNPVISSASQQSTSVTGKSGVKMTGPYEWVVPEFWSQEKDDNENDRGGAFGFNTETGPGPAIPPIETLEQILPKEHLWPIDDWWTFHAGLVDFKDIHVFRKNLDARYGEASNLDDFLLKSQVVRYEAIRAMYEAFSRNKYTSATGVIIWMLNNGWPSVIWNLYDYELRVGGGYFGAKNALEGLHPIYGYDDRAIWVVNSRYRDAKGLKVSAKIYDLNMKERYSRQENLDAPADSSSKVVTLPEIADLTSVYFLKLTVTDSSGKLVGSNFYWLTSKPETITHGVFNIEQGFAQTYADFGPLNQLQKVSVNAEARTTKEHEDLVTHITLRNENKTLAFFIRLNVSTCGTGSEIVPVLWSDNYVSLLPGESREISATYRAPQAEPVRVDIAGWNVNHLATSCANDSH